MAGIAYDTVAGATLTPDGLALVGLGLQMLVDTRFVDSEFFAADGSQGNLCDVLPGLDVPCAPCPEDDELRCLPLELTLANAAAVEVTSVDPENGVPNDTLVPVSQALVDRRRASGLCPE